MSTPLRLKIALNLIGKNMNYFFSAFSVLFVDFLRVACLLVLKKQILSSNLTPKNMK